MRNRIGLALAASMLLVLQGCVQVQSEATVYHRLPKKGSGDTFAVVPGVEGLKQSLEFETLTEPLEKRLETYGLRKAAVTDKPHYLVVVAYWIGDSKVVTESSPIIAQTGGGTTYHSGSVGGTSYSGTSYSAPTYGVVGSTTDSGIVYTRHLTVDIIDTSRSAEGKTVNVYEGKVLSTGSTGSVQAIVPHMMNALLKDFPGKNGADRVVSEAK